MRHPLARLAKGTLIYGLSGALAKLIAIVLLPVFTAYLTPAEYGAVAILTLFSAALTALFSCGLGVSIGVCYFENETPDLRNVTIWTAFVVLAGSVAILLVVAAFTYRAAGQLLFGTERYDELVLYSILACCAGILSQPFSLFFQFREKAFEFAAINVSAAVAGAATSLYLVVALGLGVTGIVIGTLVSQLAAFALFLAGGLRDLRFTLDRSVARRLIRRGVPMVPSFLSLYILLQGNQFVLKEISGLDTLGVYSVGFSLGMAMGLLVNAFSTAWPPFFLSYWNDTSSAQRVFRQVFTYYVLGFGAVSLLFFVWAKPVVLAMAATRFEASYQVVGWVATAQLFSGVFSLLLPAAYFSGKVGVVTPIQALAAIVSAGSALALIPPLGVQGAGYSLALGYLAMCVLQYAWNRLGQEEFTMTYDWRRVGRFVAGYVIIGLAFGYPLPDTFWHEVLKSMVGSLLVFSLVFLLLTTEERRAILETVRSAKRQVAAEGPDAGNRKNG